VFESEEEGGEGNDNNNTREDDFGPNMLLQAVYPALGLSKWKEKKTCRARKTKDIVLFYVRPYFSMPLWWFLCVFFIPPLQMLQGSEYLWGGIWPKPLKITATSNNNALLKY
jgi:hypothetical protein